MLGLAVLYLALFWKCPWQGCSFFRDEAQMRFILAALVLFLAQSNLGFNVLLSGTHERYLYHGFPFLILAAFFFWQRQTVFSWRSVLFCLGAAILYGLFVYSVLSPSVIRHEVVGAVQLLLVTYLFILSFKLQSSQGIPQSNIFQTAAERLSF
jgi:phosphatidylserine synthase